MLLLRHIESGLHERGALELKCSTPNRKRLESDYIYRLTGKVTSNQKGGQEHGYDGLTRSRVHHLTYQFPSLAPARHIIENPALKHLQRGTASRGHVESLATKLFTVETVNPRADGTTYKVLKRD
jgi:hypothetical protein